MVSKNCLLTLLYSSHVHSTGIDLSILLWWSLIQSLKHFAWKPQAETVCLSLENSYWRMKTSCDAGMKWCLWFLSRYLPTRISSPLLLLQFAFFVWKLVVQNLLAAISCCACRYVKPLLMFGDLFTDHVSVQLQNRTQGVFFFFFFFFFDFCGIWGEILPTLALHSMLKFFQTTINRDKMGYSMKIVLTF